MPDRGIVIVTGMAAPPPLPCPAPAPAPPDASLPAAFGTVATRPTEATVPGIVVVPAGRVTSTLSPGLTRGPPAVSETDTAAVSEVPDTTAVPTAAGVPSGMVVVTRSGPGRKVTPPSGMVPVTTMPCACCHRSTAASVDHPYWPSAAPGP